MITRDLKLKVGYKSSVLDEPLHLYMYDRNILLNIEIKDYDFRFGGNINGNFMTDNKSIVGAKSYLKVPSGRILEYPDISTKIENNIVQIKITNSSTNSAAEVGEHLIQIVLYDEDGSYLHLHPFKFYVHNLIALTGNESFDYGSGAMYKGPVYKPNLITSVLLNSIEDKLDYVFKGNVFKNTEIKNIETESKNVVSSINELKYLCEYLSNYIDQVDVNSIALPEEEIIPFTIENDEIEVIDNIDDTGDMRISLIEVSNKFHNKINPGENYKFRVKTIPYRIKKLWVRWKSSDPKIAKVNALGVVTGFRKGTATITAYSRFNNKVYDSFDVTVCDYKPPTSINFDDICVTKGSEIYEFNEKIKKLPYDASLFGDDIDVTFDDDSIAEYLPHNLARLRALKEGTTNITINLKKKPYQKITRQIIVEPELELKILNYSFPLYVGDTIPIFYDLSQPAAKIKWTVSEGVSLDSENNSITITKSGTFIITGYAINDRGEKTESISKQFTATTYPSHLLPISSFDVNIDSMDGNVCYLSLVNVTPSGNSYDTRVYWTTSDKKIATVSDLLNGASGKVTANANGVVKITATSVRNPNLHRTVKLEFKDAAPTEIKILDVDLFKDIKMDSNKTPIQKYCIVEFIPPNRVVKDLEWQVYPTDGPVSVIDYRQIPDKSQGLLTINITDTGSATIYMKSPLNINAAASLQIDIRIPVENVYFENTDITVYNTGTSKLKPMFYPSNATNQKLHWSSSDETIASINDDGVFTTYTSGKVRFDYYADDNPNIQGSINLNCGEMFAVKSYTDAKLSVKVNGTIYRSVVGNGFEFLDGRKLYIHTFLIPDRIKTLEFLEKENIVIINSLPLRYIDKEYLFRDYTSLRKISLRNAEDISECARGMFYGCTSLEEVNGLENSYIHNAIDMFYECISLSEHRISLKNAYIYYADYMFYNCRKLSGLPQINFENISSADYMFCQCSSIKDAYENIGCIDMPLLLSANSMFKSCSSMIKGPCLVTDILTDASAMFLGCENMTSLKFRSDSSTLTDTSHMFSGCSSLSFPIRLDSSYNEDIYVRTSNVKYMQYMFDRCYKLDTAPVMSYESAINTSCMFMDCINIGTTGPLELKNVQNARYMFLRCSSLRSVGELTFPNPESGIFTDATGMFEQCTSLEKTPEIYSGYYVDAENMFICCNALTTVSLMKNCWFGNTEDMFKGCESITEIKSIDGSIFNNAENLFASKPRLTTVGAITNCRLYNASGMFKNCTSLSTVSKIDIKYSENLKEMFYNCTSLREFPEFTKPEYAEDMSYMFYGCRAMTGYVNPKLFWENAKIKDTVNAEYCFAQCQSLPCYINEEIPIDWFC